MSMSAPSSHTSYTAISSALKDVASWEAACAVLSEMLQNLENATLSSEMLGSGGVGPPFWRVFCLLFECVFHVAFYADFLVDFSGIGPPKGVCVWVYFESFSTFCMKKSVLKLRHEKQGIFGSNLEGPAAVGRPA